MTPLAAHFIKQQTLPLKRRDHRIDDRDHVLQKMTDFHCFEITQARQLISDLGSHWEEKEASVDVCKELVFLPAPRTWIEFKGSGGFRQADFLIDEGNGWATQYAVTPMGSGHDGYSIWELAKLSLTDTCLYLEMEDGLKKYNDVSGLRATLAVINSPHIIGRKQHMPNAGLERRLARSMKMVGKFPLHAWTEITLNVSKPIEIDDGEPHEAHLTGRRALHFCRKHIRIRNGKLEYVSAHWRGDPAIGIKQSRYKVVA